MKQNQYAQKKRQLKFLADKLNQLIIDPKGVTISQIESLLTKIKKLLAEIAHLFSYPDLKKVLGAGALLLGLSLTNQSTAQSFAPPTPNPFGITTAIYWAIPSFADLDGDGDMDLLVGEYYGALKYYKNIGSSVDPQFDIPVLNPFGLDTTNYIAFPAFADLDGDGDIDLLVGEYDGIMQYFENSGSATNPQFEAPVGNPFGLISTDNHAAPTFADLDGDGDMDLLVGEYYGAMKYFENIGSAVNPQFAAPLLNPFELISTYEIALPSFADLDGDGNTDLIVGEYDGNFQYFKNIGSPTDPLFSAPKKNPYGLIPTQQLAFPTFVDLDGDGDMDLLAGEYYGILQYFENTAPLRISQPVKNFDVSLSPNPVSDIVQIESAGAIKSIDIFDITGKLVASYEMPRSAINLIDLKKGLYIFRITDTKGEYITKKIHKL